MSCLSEDLFVDKDPEWLKQGGLRCFMAEDSAVFPRQLS